jgi:hypothetical protein
VRRLTFSPQKALQATAQLAVERSTGGRWVFDLNLKVGGGVRAD